MNQFSAMPYPHAVDAPSNMQQPQVSTTHSFNTAQSDAVHGSSQENIHIMDLGTSALHLPMQSPIHTGLPTPPSSSRRASLQHSPTTPQTNQFQSVDPSPSTSSSHLVNVPQYTGLDTQSSGQRVMVQRQGVPIGPGCVCCSITVLAPISWRGLLTANPSIPRPSPGGPWLRPIQLLVAVAALLTRPRRPGVRQATSLHTILSMRLVSLDRMNNYATMFHRRTLNSTRMVCPRAIISHPASVDSPTPRRNSRPHFPVTHRRPDQPPRTAQLPSGMCRTLR